MGEFSNKLIAILNEKLEVGVALNALAHMVVGLGASVEKKEDLRLTNYADADGNSHANISEIPFVVLKARNSNQIRQLRQALIQNNVKFVDFTNTMTIGTYQEQIERSRQTKEADLEYYGIAIFGDWNIVSELTKKFSLWK
ncbi:MAG: DUF2000 domain-containing protein [Candidatus Diapherotrites archaeon CG08_land_8_20_14_0_20_34_12]|nr:MAG: DUF2000 domain-containing protein [Candidatus Diapherotrites archaeon CG08_land_8_20_14_0_20_34_12]